jgi:hypothetical protein
MPHRVKDPEVDHPSAAGSKDQRSKRRVAAVAVRLERDGDRADVALSAPADQVRADRLTRRFDALEMFPSASTSVALRRDLLKRKSLAEAFGAHFPGSRWPVSTRRAIRRTAATSAWSRCASTSSGLRPSRVVSCRLRPYPTVPVVEDASRWALVGDELEACST